MLIKDIDPSSSGQLNSNDWKRWGYNTLRFSSPAILAFLFALQAGFLNEGRISEEIIVFAFGMGGQAMIASLIDLFTKLRDGP